MTVERNPVVERWEAAKEDLLGELDIAAHVAVRIPGWEPVDLQMGLRWLQATIFEGFQVDSRITWSDGNATVWMMKWEVGEAEPDWAVIIESGLRA